MAEYEFSINRNYIGLDSDTKSIGRPGEKWYEFNTGKIWIHNGERWVEDLTLIYAYSQASED